jgi:hypothetical protein
VPISMDKLVEDVDTEKKFVKRWRRLLEGCGVVLAHEAKGTLSTELSACSAVLGNTTFIIDEFEHSRITLRPSKKAKGLGDPVLAETLLSFMGQTTCKFIITGTNLIDVFSLLSGANLERSVVSLEGVVEFADYQYFTSTPVAERKEGEAVPVEIKEERLPPSPFPVAAEALPRVLLDLEVAAEARPRVLPDLEYKGRTFSFEDFLGYPGHLVLLHSIGLAGQWLHQCVCVCVCVCGRGLWLRLYLF